MCSSTTSHSASTPRHFLSRVSGGEGTLLRFGHGALLGGAAMGRSEYRHSRRGHWFPAAGPGVQQPLPLRDLALPRAAVRPELRDAGCHRGEAPSGPAIASPVRRAAQGPTSHGTFGGPGLRGRRVVRDGGHVGRRRLDPAGGRRWRTRGASAAHHVPGPTGSSDGAPARGSTRSTKSSAARTSRDDWVDLPQIGVDMAAHWRGRTPRTWCAECWECVACCGRGAAAPRFPSVGARQTSEGAITDLPTSALLGYTLLVGSCSAYPRASIACSDT